MWATAAIRLWSKVQVVPGTLTQCWSAAAMRESNLSFNAKAWVYIVCSTSLLPPFFRRFLFETNLFSRRKCPKYDKDGVLFNNITIFWSGCKSGAILQGWVQPRHSPGANKSQHARWYRNPTDRRQNQPKKLAKIFTHSQAPAYSGGESAEETAYSRRRYDLPGTVTAARVLARGQALKVGFYRVDRMRHDLGAPQKTRRKRNGWIGATARLGSGTCANFITERKRLTRASLLQTASITRRDWGPPAQLGSA